MRHFIAACVLIILLGVTGGARADFNASKAWFEALSADERIETQTDLTLLGFYTYLVDGQFGNGTYGALTGFQRDLGRAATGVLIPRDRERLTLMANAVYAELGMDLVRDKESQSALLIPLGLLSDTRQVGFGNFYATPDRGIVLETSRRPTAELGFAKLYEELRAPGSGRFITYSNYNNDRFVVSGKVNGRLFYTLFQNAETDSVGYTLSWTEDNGARASMLAVFIASYFRPLRFMPAEEHETKIAETPAAAQSFGVFTLPAGQPDVIMLNGEVTRSLATDFNRALAARPGARIVALNSPGGYVDTALQVARLVRHRGMSTLVGKGMGCYSACAYIFFAGANRWAEGELGVHQISSEVADLVMAQTTLGDVLDALNEYGVEQEIISVMLKTPPEAMYVFTDGEIGRFGINVGGPIRVAALDSAPSMTNEPGSTTQVAPQPIAPQPQPTGTAYVQLASQDSEAEAERSLRYAEQRWAGLLAGAVPEIERVERAGRTLFNIRVPARSLESASALCAAIRSAGGGCYITRA